MHVWNKERTPEHAKKIHDQTASGAQSPASKLAPHICSADRLLTQGLRSESVCLAASSKINLEFNLNHVGSPAKRAGGEVSLRNRCSKPACAVRSRLSVSSQPCLALSRMPQTFQRVSDYSHWRTEVGDIYSERMPGDTRQAPSIRQAGAAAMAMDDPKTAVRKVGAHETGPGMGFNSKFHYRK